MKAFHALTKTIGRKISSGYAFAIILAIAIGTIAYFSIGKLNQTAKWVDHTHTVLGELDKITSGIKDAETGQRGFLLTGDEKYLAPYNQANTLIERAIAEVRFLTSDNPGQQQRLTNLEPLVEAKLEELQETIDLRRNAGFEAALAVVLTDRGKIVMDQIRTLIGEMTQEEADLLIVRSEEAASTSTTAILSIILITVLSVLLLTGARVFTVRSLVTPIQELVTTVQRVAQGDLTAQSSIESTDELGTLSDAFNEMVSNLKTAMDDVKAQQKETRQAEALAEELEEQQLYLSTSVDRILNAMEKFASGDLTVQLEPPSKEDDISKLYTGFNRAVANVHQLFVQVREAVTSTVSASTQISNASEQLAVGAKEQAAQSSEVASAVDELSRTIVENAASASQTANVAHQSGHVAQQGGEVVRQTVDKISQIATMVEQSAQTVERLVASSEEIGEIVSVIDDIAAQTSLLALNAAIEAARAGEHGKGFAVVADEVRQLAKKTTSATQEIAATIKTIQTETVAAVEAMHAGNAEVRSGMALADEAGQALEGIVNETQSTVDLINQIAAASEEQSVTSEEISRSVESISRISEESAQGVSEIATSAEQLNHLMNDLNTLVGQFKTDGNARRPDRVVRPTRFEHTLGGDGWSTAADRVGMSHYP